MSVASRILRIIIGGDASGAEGALDGLEGKLGSTLGKFGKFAAAAGLAAGAAVVAIGAAKLGEAFVDAIGVEKANSKLQAQLGLTEEGAAAYGRAAGNLYSQAFGDSIEDVNEALRHVTTNIGDAMGNSETALEDATATALNFASAFDQDVSASTRAVGTMLRNGLARDAEHAFDILTVGMQNGTNVADDMMDTFAEYSIQFAEVGISGEMAMGLLSQAVKGGARDADTAADAIKEFAIRSKDGSKLSAEAFATIGLDANKMFQTFAKGGPESEAAMADVIRRLKDMKDPVEQDATAIALFGAKAEDLQDALFAMDPTTAVQSLGEVEGASTRMGDALNDNAATKFEAFKRSMKQNLVDFMGNEVLPKVVEFGEQVGPALDKARTAGKLFLDVFMGNEADIPGELGEWGPKIAEFAETARGIFDEISGKVKSFHETVLKPASDFLGSTWNRVWKESEGIIKEIQKHWPAMRDAIVDLYEVALKPLITYIAENREQFKNFMVAIGVVVGLIVGAGIAAFVALVVAIGVVIAIVATVIAAFVALWTTIMRLIQWFWDLAKNIGSAIADAVRWLYHFGAKVGEMTAAAAAKLGEVIAWFGQLPGRIRGAVGDLGSMLYNTGRDIIQGLLNGIRNKWGEVTSWLGNAARNLPGWIKGPLGISSPSKVMMGLGADTVEGFALGIQQSTPQVEAAAVGMTVASVPSPRASSVAAPAPRPQIDARGLARELAAALDRRQSDDGNRTLNLVLDRRILATVVADVTRQREVQIR